MIDFKQIKNKFTKKHLIYSSIICLILCFSGFIIILPNITFNIAVDDLHKYQFSKSIKYLNITSKFKHHNSEIYSLRGYAKYQMGDNDGAIEDFDNAYKYSTDKTDLTNFDNKIFIKFEQNDFDGALKDFDDEFKNLENTDTQNTLLWDKAQFLYNIGKYKEALKCYNQLIINSDDDTIYLLKDRLYSERAQVYTKLNRLDLAKKDLITSGADSIEDSPIPLPTLMIDKL